MTFALFSTEEESGLPESKFFALHCSRCQRAATDEPILKTERAAICAALAQGWKVQISPNFRTSLVFGVEEFTAMQMLCPNCASEFEE